LLRIEGIVLISLLGDETITPRIAHHHLLDVLAQVAPQPIRQGPFLDHQTSRPCYLLQFRHESWDSGTAPAALHKLSARIHDSQLRESAINLHANTITTLPPCPPCVEWFWGFGKHHFTHRPPWPPRLLTSSSPPPRNDHQLCSAISTSSTTNSPMLMTALT